MGLQTIDAKLLSRMFLAGAKNLESNKEWINELNVFPVPDGDTGTNMTMTIMSAAKEVSDLGDNVEMASLCKAMSGGSLRGARGNSGVILSQLFRGFTKSIKELDALGIPEIAAGMEKAVQSAYKAVMTPKEGTILTVARGISEKASELCEAGESDMETFLLGILEYGKEVLAQTPEMLPVLKEAGVVDSGGQGLIQVLTGALDAYLGKELDLTIGAEPAKPADVQDVPFEYEINFQIIPKNVFNIKNEIDFKTYLETIGDKVSVTVEGDIVKIYLRTDDPGMALHKGQKHGTIDEVIIKNLKTPKKAAAADAPAPKKEEEPRKEYGFIAVSVGDGLNEIFTSLGVDVVVTGGQTMNPSTADFLDAIEKVNADTIFILPNNKNIIMAANQAAELVTEKTILVIPTKTIPQGITAIINFVPDLSPEENEGTMMEEIKNVKTGQLTYSIRDTVIDNREISKDDYMGIGDKGILSNGKDITEVMVSMIKEMITEETELISVYYGSDVSDEDAEAMRSAIEAQVSDVDIELQMGGQPVYYYIVSAE